MTDTQPDRRDGAPRPSSMSRNAPASPSAPSRATSTATRSARGNRDQIEQAIEALGYRRNAVAAAMKSDLTNIVGFLVPPPSEFHTAVLDAPEPHDAAVGPRLLTYCHTIDQRIDRRGARLLRGPPRRLPGDGWRGGCRRPRPRPRSRRDAGHPLRQRHARAAGRPCVRREPQRELSRGRATCSTSATPTSPASPASCTTPRAASASRAMPQALRSRGIERQSRTSSSTATGTRPRATPPCCG